jgi:DNA-directed RNA polymerase subunit beta
MPVTAQRYFAPTTVRNFGRRGDAIDVPPLSDVQLKSYDRFLQLDAAIDKRENMGLEGVLQEIFPIESYDKSIRLEFLRYELGKPRYDPDECRKLRLTYGRPFRVWLRLVKESPVEEEVYLGDMPIMIGGGEFIINGAERVVVSQLHRSPGVDFTIDEDTGDRRMHACRIIPERGSWIEINVTKKEAFHVRIDQSGKFPATTLLRAMDPAYGNEADIIKAFYPVEKVKVTADTATALVGKIVVGDVIDNETGEVLVDSRSELTERLVDILLKSKMHHIEVLGAVKDPVILRTLHEDPTSSHEEALLKIYQRLRPGNPPQLEKAKELFKEKFLDPSRYRLGRVGRFRINRKFEQQVPESEMCLRPIDLLNRRYRPPRQSSSADDRRTGRDELRKGFLKLRRTVQERMSLKDAEDMTPRSLDQPQEHLGGHRVLLRPRRTVAGRRPDEPAVDADARTSSVGPRPGRFESQARGLRSARRSHLALRPHLPD